MRMIWTGSSSRIKIWFYGFGEGEDMSEFLKFVGQKRMCGQLVDTIDR